MNFIGNFRNLIWYFPSKLWGMTEHAFLNNEALQAILYASITVFSAILAFVITIGVWLYFVHFVLKVCIFLVNCGIKLLDKAEKKRKVIE